MNNTTLSGTATAEVLSPKPPAVPQTVRRTAQRRVAPAWLVPTALIALSVVPIVAGAFRLTGLAGGEEITPENARFFAAPLPLVLHILSASLYCVLGAFQFAPGFRQGRPGWHRVAGRLLVLCGLVAALSGLWMTQFYPPADIDCHLLYGFRLLFGSAMFLSIFLGLAAILQRDIPRHRAWMIRGYAIGLGAGTQFLTNVPWILIFGTPDGLSRDLLMGAGWAINLVVAEWIIRRRLPSPNRRQFHGAGPASVPDGLDNALNPSAAAETGSRRLS